ncbi:MAG: acyl--CoA ligase [Kordiimonadaceae bacterium]|nr:acyl--CoA ligase [Kordiimonadaceae bacterium]
MSRSETSGNNGATKISLPRDLVRRTGLNNPLKTAYICGDTKKSWGEMHSRSDQIAGALIAIGLKVGDPIGQMAPECIAVYEQFFAFMKMGAVRVGVNRRFVKEELRHVIQDSSMKFFLVHAECEEQLSCVADVYKEQGVVMIGYGGDHSYQYDLDTLIAENQAPLVLPEISGEDTMMYSYTSGTTGVPKGAILTQKAVLTSILHPLTEIGFSRDDIFYLPTGNSWVAVVLAFLGLGNGMTHVIANGDYDRPSFFAEVKKHKVSVFLFAPTMLSWALEDYAKKQFDLSTVRMIIYGSAPASPTLIREVHDVFKKDLVNVYAATETTWGGISFLSPEDHRRALTTSPQLLDTVGRVASHFDVSIRDEDGLVVPDGEAGEIWLQGDCVMDGYLNLPEQTAEVLNDGWLRTNDIGRVDDEGYLYLLDRQKFLIISGGINVYPTAVEEVLIQHPAVDAVCVVGLPHDTWGEIVAASIIRKSGHEDVTAEMLKEFCVDKLNKPSVPKFIHFTDEDFPRTSNFKVKKRDVREILLNRPELKA